MQIKQLRIRNLRAIVDTTIVLHPKLTVLVGPNNAGKTTVLDALSAVLSYAGGLAFSEHDFRSTDAAVSASTSPAIEIDLTIEPSGAAAQFAPGELRAETAQIVAGGAEQWLVRLTTKWNADPSSARLESAMTVLRADQTPLSTLGRFPFQDSLPLHPFGAERDLRRGLSARWSTWGRIVSDSRPDDSVRKKSMRRLRAASDYLVRHTPGLTKVRSALADAGRVTGIGSMDVGLSAVPDDVDDLLRRVAIELRLPGAQRAFAGERHGLGTQGALLFAVYRLHAENLVAGRPTVSPVLTLEEPETHLHPTAQRALATTLQALPGQVVVASHSAELIAPTVQPVLLRNVGGVAAARVAAWTPEVAKNPEALFARCIVVAEGEEARCLVACALEMNIDFHQLGVEVVSAHGQGGIAGVWKTFGPLGFGIPTACVADADQDHFLDAFLRELHRAGLAQSVPTGADRYAALRRNAYFVVKPRCNIEEALVSESRMQVDSVLHDLDGETLGEWRAASMNKRLGEKARKRFNARRSKRRRALVETATVADLDDREARVHRLSQEKARLPDVVVRLVSKFGKEHLPQGFREVFSWVRKQAVQNA